MTSPFDKWFRRTNSVDRICKAAHRHISKVVFYDEHGAPFHVRRVDHILHDGDTMTIHFTFNVVHTIDAVINQVGRNG